MSRVLDIWRRLNAWQRAAAVSVAVLAIGGVVAAAYLITRRPADVSHPHAKFKPKQETHKKPIKKVSWPVYGLNPQRTRYLPSKHVHPPFGARDWDWLSPSLLEFSPIYAQGHLYVIDKNATLYKLNEKGNRVWKKDLGHLSASSPAYRHHRVFAVTLSPGGAFGLRASDGKVLWHHELPGRSESSPLIHGGRVFIGCESGDVFAYDERTGKLDWSFHSAGPVKGGVAYDHGAIFFGNYAGQVFALDSSTGKVHWQGETQGGGFLRGGGIYSTPAIAFGRVYFGGLDGRVYSYVESSGKLAWSHSTGAEVYPAPAVADPPNAPPTVYVGSQDHHFYALNARTGNLRWQQNVGGNVLGAASVVGRDVYVSVIGPNVGTYGFRVNDGKKQFYSDIGEYNPVISDGVHLYLTGANIVVRFTPRPPRKHPKKAHHHAKKARHHHRKKSRHGARGHSKQRHHKKAHHQHHNKKKTAKKKRGG